MENLGTKTLDELGRVIVPKEVRQIKGWKKGDTISFYNYSGIIVIDTSGKIQELDQMPEKEDGKLIVSCIVH